MYDGTSYWSESQKQHISVDSMPLPYARNVYLKLLREDRANFDGSVLYKALLARLRPSKPVLFSLLANHGAAAFYLIAPEEDEAARRRFRRIGTQLGVPVSTHRKGDFIEATCEPVLEKISVRKVTA